jgi:hypothetical protein
VGQDVILQRVASPRSLRRLPIGEQVSNLPHMRAAYATLLKSQAMTPEDFRQLALDLPEATESSHMAHPDFRVRGKVFATLGYPDQNWGMVKLPPEQQELLSKAEPDVFVPAKGGWGRQGATSVLLKAAKKTAVRGALLAAWRRVAPKRLAAKLN